MKFAIVKNNTVEDIIIASPEMATALGAVTCPEEVGIGWTIPRGEWLPPTPPPRWESLEQAKEQLRESITAKRDAIEAGGFMWDDHAIQTNDASVKRINSAAQSARTLLEAKGDVEMTPWVDVDDAEIPLTASRMLEMQLAMTRFGAAVHLYARKLKLDVSRANSIEALELLDIEAGWPTAG